MRVHRILLEGAKLALEAVFEENRPADRALEKIFFQNRKWGSRDRRFVAETVYDCLRWWRRLKFVAAEIWPDESPGVYECLSVYGALHGWDQTPKPVDSDRVQTLWKKVGEGPRGIAESIPEWLDELGVDLLGEEAWGQAIQALNEKAPVDLRTNTLKTDRDHLQKALAEEGIVSHPVNDVPTALTLEGRPQVFSTKAFKRGWFEMQDRSSQKVAPLLAPQPGERVVDACAGAGGKALHLAALMENRGRIIALDIHEWKLEELKKRARRAGASNIETRVITSTKVVKRLHESADAVLLDVPCTGLGVLRRNPDMKWKLGREDYERVLSLQADLLRNYAKMVKPGGRLVYSTCSFLPSENTAQIENFCAAHQGEFKIETQWTVWPQEKNGDGFFAALLLRRD